MSKDLHFKIDGKWFTSFVRSLFHYEEKKELALKSLSCIEGLSINEAYAVLNGDAEFENDGNLFALVMREDTEFKQKLAAHNEFIEKRKKEQIVEDEEYGECISKLCDVAEKHNIQFMREEGHIRSSVFSDREVVSKEHGQFESFAKMVTDECCKNCQDDATCNLLYDCQKIKDYLGKSQIPEPIDMKWREFRAGKPVTDPDLSDGETIKVIKFASIPVRKSLLDDYVTNVISRIRNAKRYEGGSNIWIDIDGLEEIRRKIHTKILWEAGYLEKTWQTDMGEDAQIFRAMVEVYVEKMAKRFGAIA